MGLRGHCQGTEHVSHASSTTGKGQGWEEGKDKRMDMCREQVRFCFFGFYADFALYLVTRSNRGSVRHGHYSKPALLLLILA